MPVTELLQIKLLQTALAEQQAAIALVMTEARRQIGAQAGVPQQFRVALAPPAAELLDFKHNLFSTFFIAVLHLLGVAPERRRVYAALNQLFRYWVTCADNLLDNEDKMTLPLHMPGRARVISQVVVIMLADRILQGLLDASVEDGAFTRAEAQILSARSLQALLPSAAEEGLEEQGFDNRVPPEYILEQLHPLKTGILFHLPMVGPEAIETGVDQERLARLKDAMMEFGLGCQLLDDVRDLARDALDRRANFLLASLARDNPDACAEVLKLARERGPDARLYQECPAAAAAVAALASQKLAAAVSALDTLGLDGFAGAGPHFMAFLFRRLDVGDLQI